MVPLRMTADHARRFLVRRQLLDPPRRLPRSEASVMAVVERLGSLQFDPLEVPGARSHDLVLHARIAGYDRSLTDRLLYAPRGERRLFEAYNKSLNILPAKELPLYRLGWQHAAERHRDGILGERRGTARQIMNRLRDEGPLSTQVFSRHHATPVDWWWAPASEGRAVVEALFDSGQVGIFRRDGSRRTYDLTERLFPADLLSERAALRQAVEHRLLSRYRGVGLMGEGGAPELVVRTGTAAERRRALGSLVKRGTLVAAEVSGLKGARYVLASELAIVDETRRASGKPPGVTLVAPLDPLLWDRRLMRDLFGFEYTWEVYTPVARRKHGYYVLPLLFGDRLVGRIEPRMDRAKGKLSILGLWFEQGFDPIAAPGFVPAFAEALSAYRGFVGADTFSMPRGRLHGPLSRALEAEEKPACANEELEARRLLGHGG